VGCRIHVVHEGKDVKLIADYGCRKGEDYAFTEILDPRRGLTTTVRVRGGETPVVSVKATRPVPKDKVVEVVRSLDKVVLDAPVRIGDVVVENALGTRADVVVTRDVGKKG